MINFKISYTKLLFIIYSLIATSFIFYNYDLKSVYVLSTITNFPLSILSTYIVDILDGGYFVVITIGVITGYIQWVLFLGYILDKFVPKIDFNITYQILERLNKYLFALGVFSFILSGVLINNYKLSAVIYNCALAFVLISIAFKVLFLTDRNN